MSNITMESTASETETPVASSQPEPLTVTEAIGDDDQFSLITVSSVFSTGPGSAGGLPGSSSPLLHGSSPTEAASQGASKVSLNDIKESARILMKAVLTNAREKLKPKQMDCSLVIEAFEAVNIVMIYVSSTFLRIKTSLSSNREIAKLFKELQLEVGDRCEIPVKIGTYKLNHILNQSQVDIVNKQTSALQQGPITKIRRLSVDSEKYFNTLVDQCTDFLGSLDNYSMFSEKALYRRSWSPNQPPMFPSASPMKQKLLSLLPSGFSMGLSSSTSSSAGQTAVSSTGASSIVSSGASSGALYIGIVANYVDSINWVQRRSRIFKNLFDFNLPGAVRVRVNKLAQLWSALTKQVVSKAETRLHYAADSTEYEPICEKIRRAYSTGLEWEGLRSVMYRQCSELHSLWLHLMLGAVESYTFFMSLIYVKAPLILLTYRTIGEKIWEGICLKILSHTQPVNSQIVSLDGFFQDLLIQSRITDDLPPIFAAARKKIPVNARPHNNHPANTEVINAPEQLSIVSPFIIGEVEQVLNEVLTKNGGPFILWTILCLIEQVPDIALHEEHDNIEWLVERTISGFGQLRLSHSSINWDSALINETAISSGSVTSSSSTITGSFTGSTTSATPGVSTEEAFAACSVSLWRLLGLRNLEGTRDRFLTSETLNKESRWINHFLRVLGDFVLQCSVDLGYEKNILANTDQISSSSSSSSPPTLPPLNNFPPSNFADGKLSLLEGQISRIMNELNGLVPATAKLKESISLLKNQADNNSEELVSQELKLANLLNGTISRHSNSIKTMLDQLVTLQDEVRQLNGQLVTQQSTLNMQVRNNHALFDTAEKEIAAKMQQIIDEQNLMDKSWNLIKASQLQKLAEGFDKCKRELELSLQETVSGILAEFSVKRASERELEKDSLKAEFNMTIKELLESGLEKKCKDLREECINQIKEQIDDQVNQLVSQQVSQLVSQQVSEQVSQLVSQQVSEQVSQLVSEQVSQLVSEQVSQLVSKQVEVQVDERVEERLTQVMKNYKRSGLGICKQDEIELFRNSSRREVPPGDEKNVIILENNNSKDLVVVKSSPSIAASHVSRKRQIFGACLSNPSTLD